MKKIFFLMLFIPIMGNAQTSEICGCADALLSMAKEAKDAKMEMEKMKAIQEKYKARMEKCDKLGKGKTDDELKKMREEMEKCASYKELEEIQKELMGESESDEDEENIKAIDTLTNKEATENYFFNGVEKCFADQYRDAISLFDKALKIDPKHIGSLAFRGICKNGDKDYVGAIADFNKAIELGKADTFIYTNRAESKLFLGDYRGAIQDCNIAIGMNISYSLAYNTRAKAKFELKDFKGALLDFNKVIQLNPKDFDAYYNRGLAKYALADKEGACLDFSKAGELGLTDAYKLIRENCN
jgi:tetratricopeptide (TPR) repeat protein